jgi:sugar lactone lactonase YvrE
MPGDFERLRNAQSFLGDALVVFSAKLAPIGRTLPVGWLVLIAGVFALFMLLPDPDSARDDQPPMRRAASEQEGPNLVLGVCPARKIAATANAAGQVVIYKWENGLIETSRLDHAEFTRALAFSPAGSHMAVGGDGARVTLWDPASNEKTGTVPIPLKRIKALAFSSDGRTIAAASLSEGRVVLCDLPGGREQMALTSRSPVISLAFSPDGGLLGTGDNADRSTISLWALDLGRPRHVLNGSAGPIHSIAFSPDGMILASATRYERGVRLWSVQTGCPVGMIAGHKGGTNSLSFSPDGMTLATAGNDAMVRLWEISSRVQVAALDGRSVALNHVGFSPDGRTLAATAADDTDVRFWRLKQLMGATARETQHHAG